MRLWGIPIQYTDWLQQKVSNRKTCITFNGHTSEPRTSQEASTRDVHYQESQFYNTDILNILNKKNSEDAVAFIDDTLLLAQGKNLEITNNRSRYDGKKRQHPRMVQNSPMRLRHRKIWHNGTDQMQREKPLGCPATRPIERNCYKYITQ